MRSVLVGLMVLSGGVFVPAQVPAVPTVPAPTWLSTSGVAAVAPRRSHLPAPTHKSRLRTRDRTIPLRHPQQPMGGHWLIGTLDLNQLRFAQSRRALNKSRGRRAEHHPTGRGHRFHPLGHTDLFTDCGVTRCSRADLPGDHLPGVQPDPQRKFDTIAAGNLATQIADAAVDLQCSPTRAQRVVLQSHWCTEECHDPVASELVQRAAVAFHHGSGLIDQLRHDLAQALRTGRRGDVHGMHDVGEQNRDLLVLGRLCGRCDRRAALATELGLLAQFRAARFAQQSRRCHLTRPAHRRSTALSCHRWPASMCHIATAMSTAIPPMTRPAPLSMV